MAATNKQTIKEQVTAIAKPITDEFGLVIWDIRFVKEGASKYLRIFIDKDGGINIDDCEKVSRAVNPLLDEVDPIDGEYIFEVSSPGVERELTCDEHFAQMMNKAVFIKLFRAKDGLKVYHGTLVNYDNGDVTLENGETGEQLVFVKKEISAVCLDDFDEPDLAYK